jgi:hypothetical protein
MTSKESTFRKLTFGHVLAQKVNEELDRASFQTDPQWNPWTPNPGPQTVAYYSVADILFYGGQAGGGKTDLLLGLALTAHQESAIFRRESGQLIKIISRAQQLVGHGRGLNVSDGIWRRLPGGRTIEFGSMQMEKHKDNWQGRPHDFYGFDELAQFAKSQFQFVIGWNRTEIVGQRCRVVAAGNPPMDEAGEWVVDYFAPWLKETHPNPAMPGELRWFVTMKDGTEVELLTDDPVDNGIQIVKPKSRTFIPASIKDNPVYVETGYIDQINSLPEPLRSQLMGDFKAAKVENPYQVFPTAWIRAAQARWTPRKPDVPLTALGNDGARGGSDQMVNAKRYAQLDRATMQISGNHDS